MIHSHIKIWLHLIWSTKNHERIMFDKLADSIQQHLLIRSKNIGLQFEMVRVQPEHVHGLINLPSDMKVLKFMKMIKGETSSWTNRQNSLKGNFKWQ